MKKWTQESLEEVGYKIENAQITSVDLSMADYGCLCIEIGLKGSSWGCTYGGYAIGHGYLGADEFKGSEDGIEYIMRIMDTVGVEKFNQMKGQYVRVATRKSDRIVKIIGNILKDQWFDTESFFADKERSDG